MNTKRIPYLLLGGALAYLPFRTFFTNALRGQVAEPLWLLIEALPEILLFGAFAMIIVMRRIRPARLIPVIAASAALLAWSLVSIAYGQVSVAHGLLGLLYDFEGLLVLLLFWLAPPDRAERKWLLRTVIGGLGLLAAVAAIESFIGNGFWQWSGFTPVQHFAGPVPQLRSLLSGPNLLAALLVISGALLLRATPSKTNLALLAGTGALLGLTYSRSAWIAIAIVGVGYMLYAWTAEKSFTRSLRAVVLGGAIVASAAAGAFMHNASLEDVMLHQQSTALHSQAGSSALEGRSIPERLLGDGIGTAGTASIRAGDPQVAESWYLQLVQEIGLIGLALYLGLMLLVVKNLFDRHEPVLAWLAVGLMVEAAFLHTWSDGHLLNVVFWLFVGFTLVAVPTTSWAKQPVRAKAKKRATQPRRVLAD
jgi:hypothetical protein